MVKSRGILVAGGGGLGVGLLLLVGGLVLKHGQAATLAKCSSGLGQAGQALDLVTARQCASAQDLSSMATTAIWIGAVLLGIAAGGLIAFFAAAGVTASRKPKVVVPARAAEPAPGGPPRPRAGEGAVLRPVVPSVVGQLSVVGQPAAVGQLSVVGQPAAVGQPGALSDFPPAQGCGHEVKNGARFCTVCGRPAAGGRDVFATGQPVTAFSGAEITTVLPVFAPPEPAGWAAPAMAAERPSGKSLAGVAPSPHLGGTDRPADPGGGARSSPPWGWADPPSAPGSGESSGPPPAEADRPPAPAGEVKSGPPWDWAEPAPAPSDARPGEDGAGSRQAGRHRSRRP